MTIKVLRDEPPTKPPIRAIKVPCMYAPTREQLEIDEFGTTSGARFHITGNSFMRMSLEDMKYLIKYLEEIVTQCEGK